MALGITLRLDYLRTIPSILRCVQIVLCIIVLICIGSASAPQGYAYFMPAGRGCVYFTAISALINTIIIEVLYVFDITTVLKIIPWILVEIVYAGIWTFFYFVSGCICIAGAVDNQKYSSLSNINQCFGAAAFFCWVAMVAYAIDVFLFVRMQIAGSRSRAQAQPAAAAAPYPGAGGPSPMY